MRGTRGRLQRPTCLRDWSLTGQDICFSDVQVRVPVGSQSNSCLLGLPDKVQCRGFPGPLWAPCDPQGLRPCEGE